MARKYLFADESGNFDFSRGQGASKYFILATMTTGDCRVGDDLLKLRRELAWQGKGLETQFHAAEDEQVIRDEVFRILAGGGFRIDATILEKSKAQPSIRPDNARFYKMAWYLHLKYLAPRIARESDELMVVGASVGTKKKRQIFHLAVQDVVWQVTPTLNYKVACWNGPTEPCLQAVDYCCWAIQRKWEKDDLRSYVLIQNVIASEFAPFRNGPTHYY
jgi:hypothetical protein